MLSTSQLISDIKSDFEGGVSLSLDWNTIIRRGVEALIENVRPETLKRKAPIYGGIAGGLYAYYCPNDVLVPSAIFGNDGKQLFTYTPPKYFREHSNQDIFTIEYINGARFIVLRRDAYEQSSLVIDEMDSIGTKTGDGTITLNDRNFLSGSAIETSGTYITDTITAVDITEYARGVALINAYIPSVAVLDSDNIAVKLYSSDTDYITVDISGEGTSSYLVDGWNQVRLSLENYTETGTVDLENIIKWKIEASTSDSSKIIFDSLSLQKTAPYYLQYYSKFAFINGTTGALWKETVNTEDNDSINIDRDVAGILHYECCLIVEQSATLTQRDQAAISGFTGMLRRKYEAYWAVHPSDEELLSYNNLPDYPSETED